MTHDFKARIEHKEAIIAGLRENKKALKAVIALKIKELETDIIALRLADRLARSYVSLAMEGVAVEILKKPYGWYDEQAKNIWKAMAAQMIKEESDE